MIIFYRIIYLFLYLKLLRDLDKFSKIIENKELEIALSYYFKLIRIMIFVVIKSLYNNILNRRSFGRGPFNILLS